MTIRVSITRHKSIGNSTENNHHSFFVDKLVIKYFRNDATNKSNTDITNENSTVVVSCTLLQKVLLSISLTVDWLVVSTDSVMN